MKRLFLILLVFVLLLAGCENVSYVEESSETGESADIYAEIESMLPDLDETSGAGAVIEKQSFIIATDAPYIFIQDEENGGTVSAAAEERNRFLYETYGTEVEIKEVSTANITKELKEAVESGTQYCNMIALPTRKTVELANAGLLYDMNTLPEFDVEKEFFDEKIAKTLATNKTLYILPDPTAWIYEDTYAMFYNREMTDAVSGYDLESLVMQGKWTWDVFYEVATKYASSTDLKNGTFGYAAYNAGKYFPKAMWVATGEKLVGDTYKNNVELSMENSEILDISINLKKYYNTNARLPLEGNETSDAFESGRLAFLCNRVRYLYALRDGTEKGSQYGFLPMPKYNENQDGYYGIVDTEARVLSVPATLKTASDNQKKFTSLVLSATCAVGGNKAKSAFVNSLLPLYLNDNSETVMIETICDSAIFDFTVVYGEVSGEIDRATCGAVADYIDFGSGLEQSINMYINSFNNYVNKHFNATPEEETE